MTLATSPLDGHGSFAWIAHPDEWMERASCALVTDAGTLVVDPVEADGLDAALAGLPPVAGVVTLLDRHGRDAAALASRLDVPRLAPANLLGAVADARPLAVPGIEEIVVPAIPGWREAALWLPGRGLLVVAEAVGTARYYRHPSEALGVHPLLRLRPPRRVLAGLAPAVIAVGHGAPLREDAPRALASALADARRHLPGAWRVAARASRRS